MIASIYTRMIQHLLPQARAWQIIIETQLQLFIEGLSSAPFDARTFVDGVWTDIGPDTTTQLDLWEGQFGLPDTGLSDADRRTRLDATWEAMGGQDPRYIEDTLQANGFDVFVHEFWDVDAQVPAVAPVVKNPFDVLSDGTVTFSLECGEAVAQCGEALAQCGEQFTAPLGFPLVNKIQIATTQFLGAGDAEMEAGEAKAQAGEYKATVFSERQYLLPTDPDTFPYFLYIGGAAYPNQATVDASRRNEFEILLLTICPGQQWLGVLVTYV